MHRYVAVGLLFGAILLQNAESLAQPTSPRSDQAVAQLEALNERFGDLARVGRSGDQEATSVARQRLQLLSSLMTDAPAHVLRLALPTDVRDGLPAGLRQLVEERVELEGEAQVFYEDHHGFSRVNHTIQTNRGRFSLHFASGVPDWMTGDRVRVRGVRVQDALALDASTTSTTSTAGTLAVLSGASGEQRTLVVLVNFRDSPIRPYTTAHASNIVLGTTDGYLRENSSSNLWLTGDVMGWFTIAMDSTVCDTNNLATMAKQAATAAGADLTRYRRFVYAFPSNACSWWGLGSVGGNPSNAWINGEMALEVAGHELGHNLGLYHSRSMDCGAASIGSTCTTSEYGDTLDLMGATRGHFNPFQKERLGWLAPSQIISVTGSGTYSIEPYAALSGGAKALKILKSVDVTTGARTYYYVEFRQPVGYDGFMNGWTNVTNGVSIHTGSESGGNTSYLLDMTPETTTWYDPALVTGRTFSDPAAGVSITTLAASASGATVSVVVPSAPSCSRVNSTVSLSPGVPSAVSPGTTVAYTMTVANNDSSACPATAFAFAPTVPSGWTGTFDVASASVAPGSSTSATFRVTSPPSAATGAFTVTARAADTANSSHAGSGSASYVVAAPPPVTLVVQVSTSQASYARNNTVTATAVVMAGSSPAVGSPVTFVFLKANGTSVTSTATTDARGYASANLRLRSRDPLGTYSVTATSGSVRASTSFSVR